MCNPRRRPQIAVSANTVLRFPAHTAQPVVLIVNATSPLKSLADVVAASKDKPESLGIGLAGKDHQVGVRRVGEDVRALGAKIGADPAANRRRA